MLPVKSKSLIEQTCVDTGLPESVVKLLVDRYYAQLRTALSGLEENRIQVPNLGTFYAKHWLFDKYIARYDREDIGKYRESHQRYWIQEEYKKRKAMILNLKSMHEEELQRKEFVKLYKKTYEKNRPDLEEQKTDN